MGAESDEAPAPSIRRNRNTTFLIAPIERYRYFTWEEGLGNMKIIKEVSAVSIIILILMMPPGLRSETFEQRGLRPVAIVIDDHRLETLGRVKAILDRSGAKGLNIFPPDVAFVYVPAGFNAS